jgi:hypothetical protein
VRQRQRQRRESGFICADAVRDSGDLRVAHGGAGERKSARATEEERALFGTWIRAHQTQPRQAAHNEAGARGAGCHEDGGAQRRVVRWLLCEMLLGGGRRGPGAAMECLMATDVGG